MPDAARETWRDALKQQGADLLRGRARVAVAGESPTEVTAAPCCLNADMASRRLRGSEDMPMFAPQGAEGKAE